MADLNDRNPDPGADGFDEASAPEAGEGAEPVQADPILTESPDAGPEEAPADSDLLEEPIDEAPAEAAPVQDAAETEEERAAREAEEQLMWLFQSTIYDEDGRKIGRVGQVYLDDQTQQPNWVTVKTGLFGMREFFIPLDEAERNDRRITVPYDKETVLAAPRTEVDQNLSPSEEDALYNHYQVPGKMTEELELAEAEPDAVVADDEAFPEPVEDEASAQAVVDEEIGEQDAEDEPVQFDPEVFAAPDDQAPEAPTPYGEDETAGESEDAAAQEPGDPDEDRTR